MTETNDRVSPTADNDPISVAEAIIGWSDPHQLRAQARDMNGLVMLEALRNETLPMEPFGSALGIRVTETELGRVVLETTVKNWQLNMGAIAHGGFLSAVMDSACGLAIHSTLPAGRACPHVQASYRFLRMAPPQAALVCEASLVHQSRILAVARAEITDSRGRTIATGESTHAIIDMPGSASEEAAS